MFTLIKRAGSGLLFAMVTDPVLLVLIQVLDGIATACFGVMVPLVASDIAGPAGRFNVSLGFVGVAIGIGGTLSTTLAGWIADRHSDAAAFAALALIGLAATLLVWGAMPETRPTATAHRERKPHRSGADSDHRW